MTEHIHKIESFEKLDESFNKYKKVVLCVYSEKEQHWKKLNPKYGQITADYVKDGIKFYKFPSEKLEQEKEKLLSDTKKKSNKTGEIKDPNEELKNKYGELFDLEKIPAFLFYKEKVIIDSTNKVSEGILKKKLDSLLEKKKESQIEDLNQYNQIIKSNELVLMEFTSIENGNCLRIQPFIENIKTEYPNLKIYTIDSEDGSVVAENLGINFYPSFIIYKNGKEFNKIKSEKVENILDGIEKLFPKDEINFKSNIHDHNLIKKKEYDMVCDSCYACFYDKFCYGYVCDSCKFYMCEDCKNKDKINATITKHEVKKTLEFHNHPLFHTKRSCICSICKHRLEDSYCCKRCDFDLCDFCLKKKKRNEKDDTETCKACNIF